MFFSGQCLFVEGNPITTSEMTAGSNLINSNSSMDTTSTNMFETTQRNQTKVSRKRKLSYS